MLGVWYKFVNFRAPKHVVVLEAGRTCALPNETKVESGTSQSKSGTSVNLSDSGDLRALVEPDERRCLPSIAWFGD